MGDVPSDDSRDVGLTRRELLARSTALGAAISVPGLFAAGVADARTLADKP